MPGQSLFFQGFTAQQNQIWDALYSMGAMINSDKYKTREFNDQKERLKKLNEEYLGTAVYNDNLICKSTDFLETNVKFQAEQEQLNVKDSGLYKSKVLKVWNDVMRYEILPYLCGPVNILTSTNVDPRDTDQELAAIMYFIKYAWDILYSSCPYKKEQFNMVDFLLKKELTCNCTCVTTLLIGTTDCLGLFPDFVVAQRTVDHVYVVTINGMRIDGADAPAPQIIGDEGNQPMDYFLKTADDYFKQNGWWSFQSNNVGIGLDYEKMTDKAFVTKYIYLWTDRDKIPIYANNGIDNINLYYTSLYLYQLNKDAALWHGITLPDYSALFDSQTPFYALWTDKENLKRKYKMLFLVSLLFVHNVSDASLLQHFSTVINNICEDFGEESGANVRPGDVPIEEFKQLIKKEINNIFEKLYEKM